MFNRARGKSWVRKRAIKFAKTHGTPSGVTIRDGLVFEYYDVFGLKWVFVSHIKGKDDE